MQINHNETFEKKLQDKQESKRIRLSVMAELGIKLRPFSEQELALLEKVEAGLANKDEEARAKACYEAHESEAKIQAAMVDAFLFQCSSNQKPVLMIH